MKSEDMRCPTCGEGVFTTVAYQDPDPKGSAHAQEGESFEILSFSCGHEVRGPQLAVADSERLTVERRTTDETVQPLDEGSDQ